MVDARSLPIHARVDVVAATVEGAGEEGMAADGVFLSRGDPSRHAYKTTGSREG